MQKSDLDPNIVLQNEAAAKRKAGSRIDAAKQEAVTQKAKDDYYNTPLHKLIPCSTRKGRPDNSTMLEHGPEYPNPNTPMRRIKVNLQQ